MMMYAWVYIVGPAYSGIKSQYWYLTKLLLWVFSFLAFQNNLKLLVKQVEIC